MPSYRATGFYTWEYPAQDIPSALSKPTSSPKVDASQFITGADFYTLSRKDCCLYIVLDKPRHGVLDLLVRESCDKVSLSESHQDARLWASPYLLMTDFSPGRTLRHQSVSVRSILREPATLTHRI